jgi:hypothetical protein
LRESSDTQSKWNTKLDRKIMGSGKVVIPLSRGYVMKKAYQLLADQVLMIERKIFNGAEDDRVDKVGGVKRMSGVNG